MTKTAGTQAHRWPTFLPDGDHFLHFVDNAEQSKDQSAANGTYMGSLTAMESKAISSEIQNNIQFASGRILFVRDRSLMAQPFDLKRLEVSGVPDVVAPQELEPEPAFSRTGFSASQNGVVVFQSAADNMSRLSWFDRAGKELDAIPAVGYRDPALSRSGGLLAISSDGYLLYMNFQPGYPELDVYDFRTHSQRPYAPGAEAQFSPDGKWVSFTATAGSGDYQDSEVFIAPFPGPGGRTQISNHSGAQARWRADGKELFYINADKKLMAVSIDIKGRKLVAGIPHVLFQTRIIAPRIVLFQYSVTGDGKRFLVNSLPPIWAAPLTVLIN